MLSSDDNITLSPQDLRSFLSRINGMNKEEAGKAKALYLKSAVNEYKEFRRNMKAVGCMQYFFLLIPFFWPFLYWQRKELIKTEQHFHSNLKNALEVWGGDIKPYMSEEEIGFILNPDIVKEKKSDSVDLVPLSQESSPELETQTTESEPIQETEKGATNIIESQQEE